MFYRVQGTGYCPSLLIFFDEMDPRSAAHVLSLIAAHLELRGESPFKVRAYEGAAKAVIALETDDLAALDHAGTLAETRGIGPATLAVIRDLNATGESSYLEQLRAETPPGLLDLMQVPGLGTSRIHQLHAALGIDSVDAMETAARDGRLRALKGFGPKTVDRLIHAVERFRASGTRDLYPRMLASATSLLAMVRSHPDVVRAELAGSLRRHCETARDVDVVAACVADPVAVASSLSRAPGVRQVTNEGTASPCITLTDGARLDLHCVSAEDFVVALWRATGSDQHVRSVSTMLAAHGITLEGNHLLDASGRRLEAANEAAFYALAGLPYVAPEMRESGRELQLAARGRMPTLIEPSDIRGVLHCHSEYSDGRASIAVMADGARARGWSYLGITDHSASAFYAGGVSRERILAQHAEIDALNAAATDGFLILKGIEADILADGTLDYDGETLDRFDFVVGSIHSRFSMDQSTMTARVLRALDDPHLTILGHPTGRLLLSRDPYPLDLEAVIDKAGYVGVALELNADPKRLDLDWRLIPRAIERGVTIAIGPDAHSVASLDYTTIGVGMARKAGVAAQDILNARSVDDVLAFSRARREALR